MSLLPAGWPFYAFTDVLGVVLTALMMYDSLPEGIHY